MPLVDSSQLPMLLYLVDTLCVDWSNWAARPCDDFLDALYVEQLTFAVGRGVPLRWRAPLGSLLWRERHQLPRMLRDRVQ